MYLICWQTSLASGANHDLEKVSTFGTCKRKDFQYCKLKDYDLTYAFYSKFPSWGFETARSATAARQGLARHQHHHYSPLSTTTAPDQLSKFDRFHFFDNSSSVSVSIVHLFAFYIYFAHTHMLKLQKFWVTVYKRFCQFVASLILWAPAHLFALWRDKISWAGLTWCFLFLVHL
jgi:hypothetical protein